MKKMNSTRVFKVQKTIKLWKAFWHKEEEEVQRDLEINVEKIVCVKNELEKIDRQID